MVVLKTVSEIRKYLRGAKYRDSKIGLVPTMGALHKGHLSLIEASKKENDLTVCSIYVNPTQFNNATDLDLYPRTPEADIHLLEQSNCDVVFLPDNKVMYKEIPQLRLDFGNLERVMEGKFRPGHFNGVGLVVSKLFHIIQPDNAYFGQKDLQQFLIIRQLVKDLSFNLQLVCCPIVREADGLAMSSRNSRLTNAQRQTALNLYQSLVKAQELLRHYSVLEVKQAIRNHFVALSDIRLEYFEIVDSHDLSNVEVISNESKVALCIAAYLDQVRLIDNILLNNL